MVLTLVKRVQHRAAMRAVVLASAFAAALAVCAPALAATFNQSGNTVQVSTVNTSESWSIKVYSSDAASGVIPTESDNRVANLTVPAGVSSYSYVMPAEHRRFRFEVTSLVPARTGQVAVSVASDRVLSSTARLRVMRSGSAVYSGAYFASSVSSASFPNIGVQANDVFILSGSSGGQDVVLAAMPSAGVLQGRSIPIERVIEYGAGPEGEDIEFIRAGAVTAQLETTIAAVDDSGSGTFENPGWAGFTVPVAAATVDRDSGYSPLTVQFDGSASSDPYGQPLTFRWEFGDGDTSTLTSPLHVYDEPGTYTVKLTVKDSRDTESFYNLTIRVLEPAPSVEPTPSVVPTVTVPPSSGGGIDEDTSASIKVGMVVLCLCAAARVSFLFAGGV